MPAAARLNDPDTSDGVIVGAVASKTVINGVPVALVGSIDSAHSPWGPPHPPHAAATIISGSSTVICEGKAVARVGDPLSCGHVIASGSPNVIVG
jgi:uncharacterized Zn-binding protein involved in type VI secretion